MARAKISSFTSTVEKTTSECPEPFWAFGMLLVGMAMCGRADEHDDFAFSNLSWLYDGEKGYTAKASGLF